MPSTATILLVHSPLLGPSSWRRCAEILESTGRRVVVPDLRASVASPTAWWARATDTAVTTGATAAGAAEPSGVEFVVVGHSGAGVVLPQIAARLDRLQAVVFVDALLPARSGVTEASEQHRAFVATLPVTDGLLPPWSRWWDPQVLDEIIPDPRLRAILTSDEPRLSPEFWSEPVPVPREWPAGRGRYLRLSPAYDDSAAAAAARGWPVRSLPGTHLDPLVRPADVAAEILALAAM
jgi:hypothetical protein